MASRIVTKIIGFLKLPAVFILFALLFLNSSYNLTGLDYLFHVKSGEHIVTQGEVLKEDVFSFTKEGQKWVNHEWFYQVFIYFFYNNFGINGLFFLKGAVFGLAFLLLVFIAFKVDWVVSFFLVFYGLQISFSRFTLRPDNFSFLFLILFLIPFIFKKKKFLFFLPFIQLFWVNIHGFFFLGPVILLIYLLLERINMQETEKSFYNTVKVVFLFSLFACLINPQPIKTLIYPFKVIGDILSGEQKVFYSYIQELTSPFKVFSERIIFFKYLIFTGLCFAFPKKLRPFYIGLWLFVVLFSINSIRNLYFLVPVGIVVFVDRYEYIKDFLTRKIIREKSFLLVRLILLFIIIWINIGVVKAITRLYGLGRSYLGKDNVVSIESIALGQGRGVYQEGMGEFMNKVNLPERMFNDFNSGSYLIFNFYPQRKVFIDGRGEVYGSEFFTFYRKILEGNKEAFKEALDKYKLQGFIISYIRTTPPPLIKFIYQEGFKCVYFGKDGIIFVKEELIEKSLKPYLVNFRLKSPKKVDLVNNLKLKSPNMDGLYNMAYVLYMLKFYNNSEMYLEEVLEVLPNHYESHYLLGKIYYKNKDYERAFSHCRSSLLFNRDFSAVKKLLAKIYIKTNNTEDAREVLSKLKIDFDEFSERIKDE